MSLVTGDADVIAHLEADLAEAEREIKRDHNHSADWWRARASGLAHAIEVIKAEVPGENC